MVVGAAGGARIITAVAQIVSNAVDFGMSLRDAMNAPRFHAQDYPDRIEITPGDSAAAAAAVILKKRGHTVEFVTDPWAFGWAQAIMRSGGRWHGATEPRGHGLAVGY
jgi:gamma-glutamyltranspeptidase/glutathione hydrolase